MKQKIDEIIGMYEKFHQCMRFPDYMPKNNGLSIPIDAEKARDTAYEMDKRFNGEKQTIEVMAKLNEYIAVNLFPDEVVIEEDNFRSINDSIDSSYFEEFKKLCSGNPEDMIRFHEDMIAIYKKRKSETDGPIVDDDEKGNIFLEMISYHEKQIENYGKKLLEKNLAKKFVGNFSLEDKIIPLNLRN